MFPTCILLMIQTTGLALASPYHAQTHEQSATPPEAGISDQYLVALGTGAESFLIAGLENRKNEQFYDGIVARLEAIGGIGTYNPRIVDALMKFVNIHSQRHGDVGKTVFAMCGALETIGMRGGGPGVDYLIDWLKTDRYVKRVRCYRGVSKNPEETQGTLRECAARGLGFSGSPKALTTLFEMKAHPPQVLFPKGLLGAIDDAIKFNKLVKEKGVNAIFATEQDPSGKF